MIMSGTILIEKGAERPRCFQIEDESHPNAWMSVKHGLSPRKLEAELAAEGWTFFFMASTIRTTAAGFDRVKMTRTALKRAIADAVRQKCNCLEIDGVATHTFLGIPYVSVSAHARNIQKGSVFAGREPGRTGTPGMEANR